MEQPADPGTIEETLNRLRASLPKSERSLVPRFVVVTIADGRGANAEPPMVTVRAATLLQAKTQEEAAGRLAAAFGRGDQPNPEGRGGADLRKDGPR